jgi:hypothetical protein
MSTGHVFEQGFMLTAGMRPFHRAKRQLRETVGCQKGTRGVESWTTRTAKITAFMLMSIFVRFLSSFELFLKGAPGGYLV